AAAPVVVAGDGAGLVDAATAGLLDGTEVIVYSAAVDDAHLAAALDAGAALVLTDTNRRQGERWTSVRYNRGYTEPAGLEPLATDLRDNRLPVFPGADADAFTVVEHRGGLTADATAYGNPVEYSPEDRPANAVDGDPTTAWRTGAFSPVVGDRLALSFDDPVTASELTLLQPVTGHVNRWITDVRLHFDDDGETVDVTLDEASRGAAPGQRVEFPERTFTGLEIEITADTYGEWFHYLGVSSTGFAELTVGDLDLHIDEVVRLPLDLLDRTGPSSLDRPLAVVLSRLRASPTEVVRADEELSLVRALALPEPRSFGLDGAARLSPRVADDVIDRLMGLPDDVVVTSSSRLPDLAFRGRAALDGDPATSWSPGFGPQPGQWIEVAAVEPMTIDRLPMTVVADGRHSVPTTIGVEADGVRVATLAVPAIADGDEDGAVTVVNLVLEGPVTAGRFRFVVDAVREVTTTDWYSRGPVSMPIGIAELGLPGRTRPAPAGRFDSGCRSDLLTVDGEPVRVVVHGPLEDAVAGRPLTVTNCGPPIAMAEGETVLRAAQGRLTGIDLNRLVLRSAAGGEASTEHGPVRDEAVASLPAADRRRADDVPQIDVVRETSTSVRVEVSGAEPGVPFWMTLGQSHNDGWRATIDGEDLGDPLLVDGFANGWLVEPGAEAFTIDTRFAPQRRVWIAIVVSGIGVLLCLALVFLASRPRPTPAAGESPEAFSWAAVLAYPGPTPSLGRTSIVAGLLGVVGLALVNPAVGLVLAAVGGAGMRWP
ncbi:MAG: discoidin domain-containing protein, partial [Acidimicrobiales bacterium]